MTNPTPRVSLAQIFASQRMAAMLGLGFASGLPLALSSGTLQAWLTVEGVDIKTIGFFALAGLPYTFKFVWAPLLDRFEPKMLGRRRGWLLITQLLLAGACWAMASAAGITVSPGCTTASRCTSSSSWALLRLPFMRAASAGCKLGWPQAQADPVGCLTAHRARA